MLSETKGKLECIVKIGVCVLLCNMQTNVVGFVLHMLVHAFECSMTVCAHYVREGALTED